MDETTRARGMGEPLTPDREAELRLYIGSMTLCLMGTFTDELLATLDAERASHAALREQFVATDPPALVPRIAVWRLLGGTEMDAPWPTCGHEAVTGQPCPQHPRRAALGESRP